MRCHWPLLMQVGVEEEGSDGWPRRRPAVETEWGGAGEG